MRIQDPYALEFEYIQQMMLWMLFSRSPAHIVQLGLGAASLTKFCYKHFPRSKITAIELNPAVIEICRSKFYLPPDDKRLSVIAMDAMEYVTNNANHSRVDILQVDLYDAQAEKPALDSPEFYQACADCLSPEGMMTVNLFCDAPDHSKNIESMEQSFEAVAWLTEVHDSNIVAIAFKKSPSINFEKLYERAALLEQQLKLPASDWVDGLVEWMHGP
jgi:spermidine synthase